MTDNTITSISAVAAVNHLTAVQVLRLTLQEGENLAEFCLALDDAGANGTELYQRSQRARELGYWESDQYGNYTATALGAELLAR